MILLLLFARHFLHRVAIIMKLFHLVKQKSVNISQIMQSIVSHETFNSIKCGPKNNQANIDK